MHGVANDTIKFVQNIINTEINSATDNPVSFVLIRTSLCRIWQQFSKLFIFPWPIAKMVFAERGETISGGNFHGEYPAKVKMSLVVVFWVCCIFVLLVTHFFPGRLWTFYQLQSTSWLLSAREELKGCATHLWVSCLPSWSTRVDSIQDSWLHIVLLLHWVSAQNKLILHPPREKSSQMMFESWCKLSLPHLTSVSENKVLCHPSSVDSLSTSAATEDHVSMGGWAARKALRVVEHVEQGKPFSIFKIYFNDPLNNAW